MSCARPYAASLRGGKSSAWLTTFRNAEAIQFFKGLDCFGVSWRRAHPSRVFRLAMTCCCVMFCCISFPSLTAAKKESLVQQMQLVSAVKYDGTLQLASSGNAVFQHLVWPDTALAEAWLAQHILQQKVTFTTGEEDRYGRLQITSEAAMGALRDGAAMLYATEGNIPESWKGAEKEARNEKRGIWANSAFVLTPEITANHMGEFHAVEGRITRIYEGKSATYLNFGADWHSDFSVMIAAKHRRSMKPLLASLKAGNVVSVRGTIYEENGPMIALTHADNLEVR